MSHYKPYPAYKNSGVEWLGQVPEHWQIKRLKHIANVQTGVAKGKDNEGKDIIEVPYLRVANVQDGYLSLDDVATIEIPRDDLARYSLQPGDVLMNEGGDFDKLGRGSVWQGEIEPCIHQNHVFAVRPTAVPPEWLNAFTGSLAAQFYFMGRAKQSTNLASISSSNIMELPVAMPPAAEIDLLLAHIDRETTRLDALVAKKTRFAELLREKRQALITHAVTKGLDPNVKMKDSGVEWLGKVPEHWKVKKLKWLASLRSGDFITSESIEEAGAYPVYGGNGLRGYCDSFTHEGIYALVGRQGALCGNINYAEGKFWASEHAVVVSPYEPTGVRWLGELLRAMNLGQYSISSAQPGLAVERIVDLQLPVPPEPERQAIAELIDRETTRIDALLSKTERSIELLKERRAALITAAVTGQIDLREHH